MAKSELDRRNSGRTSADRTRWFIGNAISLEIERRGRTENTSGKGLKGQLQDAYIEERTEWGKGMGKKT